MKELFLKIVKISFLLFSGLFVFYVPYLLIKHFILRGRDYKTYYQKILPFHVDEIAIRQMKLVGEFFGIIFLTAFVAYVVLYNMSPLGVTANYALDTDGGNISKLGPKERVTEVAQNGQTVFRQTHDLVYFTTKMPFVFDTARVHLTFQNKNPDQTIALGFQDRETWHYAAKPYDVPFLNDLSWTHSGKNPVLYQREKTYANADDFLARPPLHAFIGTYSYETEIGNIALTRLPDYKPVSKESLINSTPLRGKHVLYAYLDHEPFTMTIEKQDLNWYEDPDVMTVKIYKDKDLVYQAIADDDGVTDSSKRVLPPRTLSIKNPGKEFPESGVYRIVIDANSDTIIKRIQTNLHKIVFQGTIFPVGNKDAYTSVVASTAATDVYTNALVLGASTYHSAGKQTMQVGTQTLSLTTLKSEEIMIPQEDITKVVIPKNDVMLNSYWGYFAFDKDQFFLPTPYRVLPITKKEDLKIVDYILTSYTPSSQKGAWKTAEGTFDISSAFIKNGRLSWIIQAPHLKDNNSEILIKNIEVTFHKNPWI
ncbi:MAG: hypothetical protein Q8Q49_05120 [bacterium]|nr:hypothetical protein [bacterium]